MKFTIAYHSVWEQTLTNPEKEKYEQLLANYTSEEQTTTICPVVIKEKINGGIVATVFICNGSNTELQIHETNVEIVSEEKNPIASGLFIPKLTIPPYSAMPWSFVFSPNQILSIEKPKKNWSVLLSPIY